MGPQGEREKFSDPGGARIHCSLWSLELYLNDIATVLAHFQFSVGLVVID